MPEPFHIRELLQNADARASGVNRASIQLLCRAVTLLADQIASLAPESAPPVPVTVPDAPPAAAGMTAEQFYGNFEAIEQAARRCGGDFAQIMAAVTFACDLGARWRAATGLPLPTRPRKASR